MKQNLIIISAGKFGRETFAWAAQAIASGAPWQIKGFLDNRVNALAGYDYPVGILGDVERYPIEADDVFIGAIGDPKDKVRYYSPLAKRGARFVNVIHPWANLGRNVRLGTGIVLAPFSQASCDATIGDHVAIGAFSNVAHDAVVGDWCQIGNHCGINGNAVVGPGTLLASHVCILPRTTVGAWACLEAGSVVVKDVEPYAKMSGNPAICVGQAGG